MRVGAAQPATLTLYNQFDNPARQPLILEVKSFKEAYGSVLKGRCVATVMRDVAFAKLNKESGDSAKVIYKSEGVTNQGFSAGPKLSVDDRRKIIEALLAPEAKTRLAVFFERYNKDKDLVKARPDDYTGLAALLKDVWGFELEAETRKVVAPAKGATKSSR